MSDSDTLKSRGAVFGVWLRRALIMYDAVLLGAIILLAFGVNLVMSLAILAGVGVYFVIVLLVALLIRFVFRAIRRQPKTAGDLTDPRVAALEAADPSRPLLMRTIVAGYRAVWYRRIGLGKLASLTLVLCIVSYAVALAADIRKVTNFCSEAKPGMAVSEIPELVKKHKVDLFGTKDSLGIKVSEDEWWTGAVAPLTLGQYGCGIYHNQKTVTRVLRPLP